LIHEDMNPETVVLLQSMPPGDSMDIGKRYDNMIGCATCSLSQCLMQKVFVIRRECGQTLGRVRVRTVVIISLQRTKG